MTTPADSAPLPPALLARSQKAQVATDEANARKAATDADTSALTLAQTQVKAFVPNLSGAPANAVSDRSTGVVFSGLVTYSALNHAAEIVAERISKTLSDPGQAAVLVAPNDLADEGQTTILVTSQSDLLTNDLLSVAVRNGLEELIAFADIVLQVVLPSPAEPEKSAERREAVVLPPLLWAHSLATERHLRLFERADSSGLTAGLRTAFGTAGLAGAAVGVSTFPPAGIAAAAVAAIPSIISLFSATTTVKDHSEDLTDLAATTSVVAAVAERLPGYTLVHEDFRLAPTRSTIRYQYHLLATKRTALLLTQENLQVTKNEADLELARAQQKQHAPKKPRQHAGQATQQDAEKTAPQQGVTARTAQPPQTDDPRVAAATEASAKAAAELTLITGAIASIDAFTAALNTTATGTRSPLAIASLNELLHQGGDNPIGYVLSVKGLGGQSHEYTRDRHVGFDTYTTLADASLSFMLYDTATRKIVSSGVANGVSSVHGRLGHPPTGLIGPNSSDAIADQADDFPPPDAGEDQQAEHRRPRWRRWF